MDQIDVLESSPKDGEYVSLAEHQSSTPATFSLEENPVLHHKSVMAAVQTTHPVANIPLDREGHKGDIYVSSNDVAFWFPGLGRGISVPYRVITLHAIQMEPSPRLYFQLEPPGTDQFIEMTVIPINSSTLRLFYKALSDCASLHPDAEESEDGEDVAMTLNGTEEVDMEPWITTENFQDGDADDIGDAGGFDEYGEPAGIEVEMNDIPVHAGLRRTRDDNNSDNDDDDINNKNNDKYLDSAKWRRTD